MEEQTYKIRWELDVEAKNPEEAVQIARAIQLDEDCPQTIFKVDDLELDCKEIENKQPKRRMVYVAGPYRGESKLEIQMNRQLAKIASRKLLELGYIPLVPHATFLFDEENDSQEFVMDTCLEAIKHCDLLVLLPGWQESKGALQEKEFAENLNMPVLDLEVATNLAYLDSSRFLSAVSTSTGKELYNLYSTLKAISSFDGRYQENWQPENYVRK